MSRLEFFVGLFKSRAVSHKWLLNACPRQKYSRNKLLIGVFIQI